MRPLAGDRRAIVGAIIAAIIIIIVLLAVVALVFLPFRETKVDESRQAALAEGTSALNLTLDMGRGSLEVRFVDDPVNAVTMTVRGSERSGLLGPGEPVNVSWTESSSGKEQSVSASIRFASQSGWLSSSNINCTVNIAKQLRTSLMLNNGMGSVDVRAGDGVVLGAVNIRTSTGGSSLIMSPNATLDDKLTMDASLGGVILEWTDAVATNNASIDLKASTGGVRASVRQTTDLGTNLTLRTQADLGGVSLSMDITGNNSARVNSSAQLGGISVQRQEGFNGSSADLTSRNHPGNFNFDVTCRANTGGVSLDLRYNE